MKKVFKKLFGGNDKQSQPRAPNQVGKFKSEFDQNYFIGKTLGSGSFAQVKEAIRKADSQKFAVKMIQKSLLNGDDDVKSEIEVLEKLNHPNVIGLRDKYESDSFIYLVTDLASGGELFEAIVEKGSYTEKDAAVLVTQLIHAIDYLHNMDIVHRDLKPENLLFLNKSETSPIMITDFGLSKAVHENEFLQTACGTPGYVAPEILNSSGYGKPVDMWAMGVITYVLLCGYAPFYGEDQPALFQAIINADYAFDVEYWSDISNSAKDFIQKLLDLNPKTRLTAKEALLHPWITKDAPRATIDLLPSYKKNFNAKKTFKKAVQVAVLSQHLGKLGSSNNFKAAKEGEDV